MTTHPPTDSPFDDAEDDGPDDRAALDDYADELVEACDAFGIVPLEDGERRS